MIIVYLIVMTVMVGGDHSIPNSDDCVMVGGDHSIPDGDDCDGGR